MTRESIIYAKEQQIKIIDNILCSLCSLELTADGRKYLKKMKVRIISELESLKSLHLNNNKNEQVSHSSNFKLKLPDSIKSPW